MEIFLNELRFALRGLRKNLGFTAAAVLTLALGIGANTAIFSVIQGILLEPLAYPDPDRLMRLWPDSQREDNPRTRISYPNFIDWQQQSKHFETMAAFGGPFSTTVVTDDGNEVVQLATVSGDFFRVLGVAPHLGTTQDMPPEASPGGQVLVVISHALWQRRFGGDPTIVGTTINVGRSATVVAVMPEGFSFPEGTEAWTPLILNEAYRNVRQIPWMEVIARLAPGAKATDAQSEMDVIARGLEEQFPEANAGMGIRLASFLDETVKEVRPFLLLIFGVVVLVLMVACANVASLLLARGAARTREVAIRIALGAGRWPVVRQLLLESFLLAFFGLALGLLFAYWGMGALKALAPPWIPRLDNLGFDTPVLLFSVGVALLTGFLFGLVPALQTSRPDLTSALKEGGARGSSPGRGSGTLRKGLVIFEVAITLVLLVGGGLLYRSFQELVRVDPGFNPQNLLTLRLNIPGIRYPGPPEQTAFYSNLLRKIEELPGVQSATAINSFLTEYSRPLDMFFLIEGRPAFEPEDRLRVIVNNTSAGFFETLGIAAVEGRTLRDSDDLQSPEVVVINETMKKMFWPDQSPLGQKLILDRQDEPGEENPWRTIVGVVADVQRAGPREPIRPAMYLPQGQRPSRGMVLMTRTQGDPKALINPVREVIQGLDPNLAGAEITTVEELLDKRLATHRFSVFLLGVFALVVLVLAAVGLYGIISYTVNQHIREMGLRIALGAQAKDIVVLVLKQGALLAVVGVVVGIVVAAAGSGVLKKFLFGIPPFDLLTYLGGALFLLAIALVASFLPARRASRTDPIVALREE